MRQKTLRGHLEAKCILPRSLRYDQHLGDSLSYLRAVLGLSWGHLGASWQPLEAIFGKTKMVSRLGAVHFFAKHVSIFLAFLHVRAHARHP